MSSQALASTTTDSFALPRPAAGDDSSCRLVRPARAPEGEESRTRRFDALLVEAARRLGEVNALHQATLESQRQAMDRFQDAQEELLAAFQRAQADTLSELQRLHDEVAERSRETSVRARVSLLGSFAALVASCALLIVSTRPPTGASGSSTASAPAPAAATAPTAAALTLPAGLRR